MKASTRRKPLHTRVVRLNICLPPGLIQVGEKILLNGRYTGWSDYFASKLRDEAVAAEKQLIS